MKFNFQMLCDNDSVSSLMFTLQPQECRSLLLEFKAVQIGAHIGSLRIARRFHHSSKSDATNEPRLLFKVFMIIIKYLNFYRYKKKLKY